MAIASPYAKAFVGRWEDIPQKTYSFLFLLLLPLPLKYVLRAGVEMGYCAGQALVCLVPEFNVVMSCQV